MPTDIVPIIRPTSAAQILTDAVNAAHAAGLTISTDPALGVVCTSTAQPHWEPAEFAPAVSVLGAVLLARQPAVCDVDAALGSVFGSRPEFHEGIEDGCAARGQALKDRLYADGYLLGVQLRTLVSTVPCDLHAVRYPRGQRCPKCLAGLPVERAPTEVTEPMQIDTPRSLIAELLNALTPAQGLEALADSFRARLGLPADQANDLDVAGETLRELAAELRGLG